MLGWLLVESSLVYPKVMTSREIQRKLGIAYNTALLLKRRLQLFSNDLMPAMKNLFGGILGREGSSQPDTLDDNPILGLPNSRVHSQAFPNLHGMVLWG